MRCKSMICFRFTLYCLSASSTSVFILFKSFEIWFTDFTFLVWISLSLLRFLPTGGGNGGVGAGMGMGSAGAGEASSRSRMTGTPASLTRKSIARNCGSGATADATLGPAALPGWIGVGRRGGRRCCCCCCCCCPYCCCCCSMSCLCCRFSLLCLSNCCFSFLVCTCSGSCCCCLGLTARGLGPFHIAGGGRKARRSRW